MADWQKDYPLPPDLTFSLESFLQGAVSTPSRLYPDQTTATALHRLEELAEPLAQALGLAPGPFTRSSATTRSAEGTGPFVFPTERRETRLDRPEASWFVVLERLDNGHLGCFEDDLSAHFQAGARQVTLRANLFQGQSLTLTTRGLTTEETAAVEAAVVGALDLQASR